jgi:hypothetical protein
MRKNDQMYTGQLIMLPQPLQFGCFILKKVHKQMKHAKPFTFATFFQKEY